jgi:glutaredoxin
VRSVTLYTRPGCHLCDEAREAILSLRPELPTFDLMEVDIGSDDALHSRYLERIPVIEVDGTVVSELVFDPSRLRASLDTVRP